MRPTLPSRRAVMRQVRMRRLRDAMPQCNASMARRAPDPSLCLLPQVASADKAVIMPTTDLVLPKYCESVYQTRRRPTRTVNVRAPKPCVGSPPCVHASPLGRSACMTHIALDIFLHS